jgi:hypothetical protein
MADSTTGPPAVGVNSHTLTSTGQSKYYVVIITSTRWGTVQAWLPDSVQMTAKSSWGPIVGNIESAMANWFGVPGSPGTTFFSRKLSAQEWRGVEPFQLILPLHFFATEDAHEEVIEPIKRLLKISLPMQVGPKEDFFNLRAPGPVPAGFKLPFNIPGLGDTLGGGGREFQDIIHVYLGNFLALKEVFIADIPSVQFSAKLSKDGLPMEGTCTVVFKTVYAPTTQDMDIFFGSSEPLARPDLG